MKHVYEGYATGFVPSYVIYNFLDDTEGFIGYLPSDNSIYFSSLGSASLTLTGVVLYTLNMQGAFQDKKVRSLQRIYRHPQLHYRLKCR